MSLAVRRSLVALAALLVLAPAAFAAAPRTTLADVEDEVMCPSCHEPLALAQSPQANAERNFIRMLIGQGETKAQIKQALVSQYGPAVLAQPPADGFNLTVYVLPPVLLVTGIAVLAVTLPRWRRRTAAARAPAGDPAADERAQTLSADDARRLDEDLARFG